MKRKPLCLIAGSAPTYREPIYVLLGQETGCDFVVGAGPTRQMDIEHLPNEVFAIQTKKLWRLPLYCQAGAIRYSKRYDTLILCMGIVSITEWVILFLSKIRHQRTFIWSHGWLGKDKGLKRVISKFYFRLCNGVFVYNERSTALMARGGIDGGKLHTIYNSLDYDVQLLLRNSLKPSYLYLQHFNNDYKNIIFIGRLTKVKRFDLLIDAVAKLKLRGELINVTFIGDGVERRNMELLIREKGIEDQVWFYGACFDEHTNAELIFNADLCVSPGNIGLTAMHVLMFGCPAITNDDFNHQMPEFEAIKEGKTGAFFRVNDSDSLADCISKWFKNHPNDRESIRQSCYEEIDTKWNPHNQISILKTVLSIDEN